jgi:hypothetical protein
MVDGIMAGGIIDVEIIDVETVAIIWTEGEAHIPGTTLPIQC